MNRYYHVTTREYRTGDDLPCFDELCGRGYEPVWKWEDCDPFDTDVVCVYETLADAQEHIENFGGDVILEIAIPEDAEDVRYTRVNEGYLAIYNRIPAEYISRYQGA